MSRWSRKIYEQLGGGSGASQSADSTVSATVIERLTALVDALESGQATDQLLSLIRPQTHSDSDGSFSTSTSWKTGASIELANPRLLREIRPYWRDSGASGSDHNWRLLVALDSSETASGAPTGSLSDGDGWAILDDDGGSTIASGGDGPDITEKGYRAHTHLVAFQLQATSSGSSGRAQLSGVEGV